METEGGARSRRAAVLEDVQVSLTVCCFDMFESRNKVVPSVLQADSAEDFDFEEISHQRSTHFQKAILVKTLIKFLKLILFKNLTQFRKLSLFKKLSQLRKLSLL